MVNLRYVYPTITTINFGDHVIDYATRNLLAQHFPPPAADCDTRAGRFPDGEFDCLLIPGITHLTAGAHPGLEHIDRLPYPTYCLNGNLWSKLPDPGVLIRMRVLRFKEQPPPDLRIVRKLAPPVGARDPFTYNTLKQSGIPTLYTGCSTLFLPADGISDDGYLLFSFGRGNVRGQARAGMALARKHQVVGICHEAGDFERYRAAGWTLPLVTYTGDIELYLSYFKRASLIVTGRLHGALPGLAYGKRVFMFGGRDTRTTILDDLGVPIHAYQVISTAPEQASAAFNRGLLDYYRQNWETLLETIIRECAERNSAAVK